MILSANNREIGSVEDLEAVVKAAKADGRQALLLRVRGRGAPELSVPIRIR